ncbi:FG-GAP repeat protein [Streptosporangium sp. NBC_01639]|uniref:FG-GAP repeat protein n=1 Tax=Streptosporangium sp. NBC_01639 TaxID=2975948 RepID=UPI00386829EC|nr:FG-GAP repeat protein [Streptosporangium sp. NBC_01639]
MRAAFLASAVLAPFLVPVVPVFPVPIAPVFPVPVAPAAAAACSGAPSDFDADGRTDLAVAAPYTAVGGHARAGSVTVLYGMRTERRLTQDDPGVPGEAETGDVFGSALATGDFDGDRCADLAVGVSDEDRPRPGADGDGAVQLFHGSADGLRPGALLDAGDLGGRRGPDRFGAALAAGDLDGDGDDELVIGVPGLGGGAVGVYGLKGRRPQLIEQDGGWVGQSARETDQFGAVLAAGDFDGDGRAEIAVGAPGDSFPERNGQGSVTVLDVHRRKATLFTQDSPGIAGLGEAWDLFGSALASGDFDADGRADLAIGVPGEGLTDNQRAMDYGDGTVDVLYGSRGGLGGGRAQAWSQRSLVGEPRYYDRFGAALAAGDLNGDGDDELAVGVPGENAVQVLAGGGNGLTGKNNALVPGRSGDFGAALATVAGRGLVVAAPGDGRLTLLRGSIRKGAYPGVRPATTARILATAAKGTLFGYALTGPSTAP